MPTPKQPRRIKAPTSTVAGDLSSALRAVSKASGKTPVAVGRKRHSNNPARVPTNEALRLTKAPKKLPSAEELLRDTATAPLGTGERTRGTPLPPMAGMPTATELFEATAEGALGLAGTTAEGGAEVDRTEYLSPPNSLDPARPRAREAQYNPDTRQLRVVFRDGGTYVYFGVPIQTWRALKGNRSFGQTLDRLIINTYPFERVAF